MTEDELALNDLDTIVGEALELLNAHQDYRVLRKMKTRDAFAESAGLTLSKGVIVDTETTGANPAKDSIVEIGMILFEFDPETGQAYRVLGAYDQLEDPGFSIPAEATKIHGITDDMVAGQRIDDQAVSDFLNGVTLVVAHNAKFDRVCLERRLPIFASLPWACSLTQVNWQEEGIGSAKLDYIAFQNGFFYDAHRAEEDCRAVLEILQKPLPVSGVLTMKAMLLNSAQNSYQVFATGAAFHTQDVLKARSYRWDPVKKSWHTTVVGEAALDAEAAWLSSVVYLGKPARLAIELHTSLTRFSSREGVRGVRDV